jgi:hypothetical protein
MRNFNVKSHRKALFSQLAHVLVVSQEKFDMEKASNRDRQGWARIIIAGAEAYAKLLEAVQLEALEKRVARLEHSTGETM